MPVIEMQGLTKCFAGVTAVDAVNLTVSEGTVLGLVGPNGAGKTTTIKMLMGLLLPTAGSATVLNRAMGDAAARHYIGYVPDTPRMYPWFRVEEILFLCSGFYENWDWDRVDYLQAKFHLPLDKRIRSLSRGMTTMVALMIALAVHPRLLILDEPTAGLDPIKQRDFFQLVLEEVAAEGTTVLLSTHHLGDLESLADQVALMQEGKLVFCRELEEIKQNFRRIQAAFPQGQSEEELSQFPGVLATEKRGNIYSFIIDREPEQMMARLKTYSPTFIEMMALSLDEVFYYTVGGEHDV